VDAIPSAKADGQPKVHALSAAKRRGRARCQVRFQPLAEQLPLLRFATFEFYTFRLMTFMFGSSPGYLLGFQTENDPNLRTSK
jgi:hypothetical protein